MLTVLSRLPHITALFPLYVAPCLPVARLSWVLAKFERRCKPDRFQRCRRPLKQKLYFAMQSTDPEVMVIMTLVTLLLSISVWAG